MNVHDSEKILGMLSKDGYCGAERPEDADLIIFNTCAIREKAEQKFYSQLGRTKQLKKLNKGLKIAVAGCVAQDAKERIFRRAPYIDYIFGPQNIHLVNEVIAGCRHGALLDDNRELASREVFAERTGNTKAWVSIMYGCNNFCSYCIVPFTRGREVSRPSSSILAEVRDLAGKGYKEVTLLGQNVNSYRSDIDFPDLLRRIDDASIDRIRFVTSHPRDFSPRLISAMSVSKHICEHIHLPIQSGSDKILARMNRGYTLREYREKIDILRTEIPGVSITADVIAGFPGEDDADHRQTLSALKDIGFDGIFAFKYSPRRGTRAAEMDSHVADEIKSRRLNEILLLQEEITFKKNEALEGTIQEILLEGTSETDDGKLMGRTRTNKIVTIDNNGEGVGSSINVRIGKARLHSLSGVRVGLKN